MISADWTMFFLAPSQDTFNDSAIGCGPCAKTPIEHATTDTATITGKARICKLLERVMFLPELYASALTHVERDGHRHGDSHRYPGDLRRDVLPLAHGGDRGPVERLVDAADDAQVRDLAERIDHGF